MSRDRIYGDDEHPDGPFTFDDRVVRVFPDMIRRSVPGYDLLLELTGNMVADAVQPGSRVYDLGCSLGAATLAARRAIRAEDVEIVAVDNAEAMVTRCREVIAGDNSSVPVEVLKADVTGLGIENASVVLMYYTLQFIPPGKREAVIGNIHEGLRPGGVLLLAEKLRSEDETEQAWITERHHDFKRQQGYSDLEIARKRQALENVLVPDTRARHIERLKAAGFDRVHEWLQCLNFAAFVEPRISQIYADKIMKDLLIIHRLHRFVSCKRL